MRYVGPKLLEPICERAGILIFDRVVSIMINQDDCPTRDQLDPLIRFPKLDRVQFCRMDQIQLAREIEATRLNTRFHRTVEDSAFQATVLTTLD